MQRAVAAKEGIHTSAIASEGKSHQRGSKTLAHWLLESDVAKHIAEYLCWTALSYARTRVLRTPGYGIYLDQAGVHTPWMNRAHVNRRGGCVADQRSYWA